MSALLVRTCDGICFRRPNKHYFNHTTRSHQYILQQTKTRCLIATLFVWVLTQKNQPGPRNSKCCISRFDFCHRRNYVYHSTMNHCSKVQREISNNIQLTHQCSQTHPQDTAVTPYDHRTPYANMSTRFKAVMITYGVITHSNALAPYYNLCLEARNLSSQPL